MHNYDTRGPSIYRGTLFGYHYRPLCKKVFGPPKYFKVVQWTRLNSNIPHSLPTQDPPPPEETKESLTEDRKDEIRKSHSLNSGCNFGIEHKTAHVFFLINSFFKVTVVKNKKCVGAISYDHFKAMAHHVGECFVHFAYQS